MPLTLDRTTETPTIPDKSQFQNMAILHSLNPASLTLKSMKAKYLGLIRKIIKRNCTTLANNVPTYLNQAMVWSSHVTHKTIPIWK